jgi:NADPH:quinone reductase-like Zn-dependent oxidoreductase
VKAVVINEHGGPEKLQVADVPEPQVSDDEVLVRVRACALNHLDIWVRTGTGTPKLQFPHILGSDIAGEVAKISKNVPKNHLKIGERVVISPGIVQNWDEFSARGFDSLSSGFEIMGAHRAGGYAEFAKTHYDDVIPVSEKLSFEEWAAVPVVFLTAWHMLVTRAQLRPSETVLVHAAGSGVGHAAIQVAKLLGARRIFTTVGDDAKAMKARELGADEVINYKNVNFADQILRATENRGVDVIFEHIGVETWADNLRCLAKGGRMVTCGTTSGGNVSLDARPFYRAQHTILGSYLGGRFELLEVLKLIEAGKLRPVVDSVFPLERAADAHRHMESRKFFGKIVLKI